MARFSTLRSRAHASVAARFERMSAFVPLSAKWIFSSCSNSSAGPKPCITSFVGSS